jgi:hypothetical protein
LSLMWCCCCCTATGSAGSEGSSAVGVSLAIREGAAGREGLLMGRDPEDGARLCLGMKKARCRMHQETHMV